MAGAGRQWQPAGVGAYTGVEQPPDPEESYVPPIPDEKAPPPTLASRRRTVVFVLVVAGLLIAVTVWLLA
jgi:hypothetical protein